MQSTLFPDHREKVVAQFLSEIEHKIASVFFPTSGPVSLPVKLREKTQRDLIEASGVPIDVDNFIRGNPLLHR